MYWENHIQTKKTYNSFKICMSWTYLRQQNEPLSYCYNINILLCVKAFTEMEKKDATNLTISRTPKLRIADTGRPQTFAWCYMFQKCNQLVLTLYN